jgi:RNA polymerase sigma-70 factor, ECF subfamily
LEWKLSRRDRRHARWLKAARGGDGEAFARLFDELHSPVAQYLGRRVSNPQDAEDLISLVFHKLLKNLERFDPRKGSALGWTLTMARHALIDHLRQCRDTVSIEEMAEVLGGPSPDPLSGLIRTELADRLRAALLDLPAQTREIIALHYGQELRLRDIGRAIGLSEAVVKQRLSRARRELQKKLVIEEEANAAGAEDHGPQ